MMTPLVFRLCKVAVRKREEAFLCRFCRHVALLSHVTDTPRLGRMSVSSLTAQHKGLFLVPLPALRTHLPTPSSRAPPQQVSHFHATLIIPLASSSPLHTHSSFPGAWLPLDPHFLVPQMNDRHQRPPCTSCSVCLKEVFKGRQRKEALSTRICGVYIIFSCAPRQVREPRCAGARCLRAACWMFPGGCGLRGDETHRLVANGSGVGNVHIPSKITTYHFLSIQVKVLIWCSSP